MLNDFNGADRVFLATGFTDLRRGIDGLASIVQQQFELDPFTNTLFLFCGIRPDPIVVRNQNFQLFFHMCNTLLCVPILSQTKSRKQAANSTKSPHEFKNLFNSPEASQSFAPAGEYARHRRVSALHGQGSEARHGLHQPDQRPPV